MADVLKLNSKGQVAYNKPDEVYLIEFGTVQLKMNSIQFHAFKQAVANIDFEHSTENKFNVDLIANKITLRFSRDEAPYLLDLLGLTAMIGDSFHMKMQLSMN
jgi:hypothetical protein